MSTNGALFVSLGGLLSCVAVVDSAELAPPLVDVNGTPATVVDSKIVVVPSSSFADDSEDEEEDGEAVVVLMSVVRSVTVLPRESVVVTVLTAPGCETVVVTVSPDESVVVKTTGMKTVCCESSPPCVIVTGSPLTVLVLSIVTG